jgi:hypothetical protein
MILTYNDYLVQKVFCLCREKDNTPQAESDFAYFSLKLFFPSSCIEAYKVGSLKAILTFLSSPFSFLPFPFLSRLHLTLLDWRMVAHKKTFFFYKGKKNYFHTLGLLVETR